MADVTQLWEEAKIIFYDEIGEKKIDKIGDSTSLQETINHLKTSQTRLSKQYGSHDVKLGSKSIQFNVGKIMQRLELLLQIGDEATNFAPESVSLVWAAFRMIFTGFLIDAETCQVLVDAVDQISDVMFVCEVYARRYLMQDSVTLETENIGHKVLEQIPPIYATVLKFSYETRRLLGSNKFSRSCRLMFGRKQELGAIIEEVDNKREKLHKTADIAFKEATMELFQSLNRDMKALHQLFDTIDAFLVPAVKNLEVEQSKEREQRILKQLNEDVNDHIKWLKTGGISVSQGPSMQYKLNLEKRYKGTGVWVLDTQEYAEWHLSEKSDLLWIHGPGGFGKSIVMSSVIESIENEIAEKTDRKPMLIYFFCKSGNDTTQKGHKILLHLLAQIFEQLNDEKKDSKHSEDFRERKEQCVGLARDAREKLQTTAKSNSALAKIDSTLQPLLGDIVEALKTRIYIAIDGLDECVDRNDGFLETLANLSSFDADLRVILSSRAEIDLQIAFRGKRNIEIDENRTVEDVKSYVKASIMEFKKFSPRQKAKASSMITRKSEGNFRYASVVLEGLSRSSAKMAQFNTFMQGLPNSMNEVYRKSIQALPESDRPVLITALRWLVCGEGRIDVNWIADELGHAYDQDEIDADSINEDDLDIDDGFSISEFESQESSGRVDDQDFALGNLQELPIEIDEELQGIISNLHRIGRDFLKFNGLFVDLDHNSVRDFIAEDEKLGSDDKLRCADCSKRIVASLASEAGSKHGHFIMTRMCLKHLNSPIFQKRFLSENIHIEPPIHTDEAQIHSSPIADSIPATTNPIRVEDDNFGGEFKPAEIPEKRQQDIPVEVPGDHSDALSVATTDAGFAMNQYMYQEISEPRDDSEIRYELVHWSRHLRAAENLWPEGDRNSEVWETIYQDVERFLDVTNDAYRQWLKITYPWRKFLQLDDPLHVASRLGLANLVRRYLKRNLTEEYINMRNENNCTPLFMACIGEGDFETISALVSAGADVNAKQNDGSTPLLGYLMYGLTSTRVVNFLLENGANVHEADHDKFTCLHFAADSGSIELCRVLLAREDADIDARDYLGETPLHCLLRFPSVSAGLINLFLNRKPDINAQDKDGQAPLYEACSAGNVVAAELLLNYRDGNTRVDINDIDVFGCSALHAAIRAKSLEIVKLLVSRGANISLKDKQKQDPVLYAVENGEAKILTYLLESWKKIGSDMRFLVETDIHGQTALHKAAARGSADCVKALLHYGDDAILCAQINRNGATPLHSASRRGHADCVEQLIRSGADVHARTSGGETALDLAFGGFIRRTEPYITPGFRDTIILLAKEAPKMIQNTEILDWAIEMGLVELCQLLAPELDRPFEDGWSPHLLAKQCNRSDLATLLNSYDTSAISGPSKWVKSDLVTFPIISDDGLEISCTTENDDTAIPKALVLADCPVIALSNHYYFEVIILESRSDYPILGVGFTGKYSIRINNMPGWEDVEAYSWGYHADDGWKFEIAKGNIGSPYAEEYGRGDVIGCGVDFNKRVIYYTKNGVKLPDAFTNVYGRLYPVVGLSDEDIKVRANFGQNPAVPFQYQP